VATKFPPVKPPPAPNPYNDVPDKGVPSKGTPNSFNPFTVGDTVNKPAGGKNIPGLAIKGPKKLDPKLLAAIMRRLAVIQNTKGA
jgi:hypothetical protein